MILLFDFKIKIENLMIFNFAQLLVIGQIKIEDLFSSILNVALNTVGSTGYHLCGKSFKKETLIWVVINCMYSSSKASE